MNIFLSHKYKAPKVNEFFFRLCSDVRKFEFSVDEGEIATNVTRLERLVRDADGFLGIYPFDDEYANPSPSPSELRDASKYFRLEIDLAARSRRPALIFTDKRFKGLLRAPAPMMPINFDVQEIAGADGETPGSAAFRKAFSEFCDIVEAWRALRLAEAFNPSDSYAAGIVLPRGDSPEAYSTSDISAIADKLRIAEYEPVELPWPPVLNADWIAKQRSLNFAIVDLGEKTSATGITGYLHGAFTPCMRMLSETANPGYNPPLFSGFEAGYPKDIIRWTGSESLIEGVSTRLATMGVPRTRITSANALNYFRKAAKRKEAVFMSYAGADLDLASGLADAFKKRFARVFDYRDSTSIRPGKPWPSEIFDQLSVSPIGVPLLSPAYFASGNCRHELDQMIAQADSGKMQIFPVKLRDSDQLQLPNELQTVQYVKLSRYPKLDDLIEWIISNLPPEGSTAKPQAADSAPQQS